MRSTKKYPHWYLPHKHLKLKSFDICTTVREALPIHLLFACIHCKPVGINQNLNFKGHFIVHSYALTYVQESFLSVLIKLWSIYFNEINFTDCYKFCWQRLQGWCKWSSHYFAAFKYYSFRSWFLRIWALWRRARHFGLEWSKYSLTILFICV